MDTALLKNTKEAEILKEIRECEKKADEVIEKAKRKKENILDNAQRSSAKLLSDKKEEIRQLQEEKLAHFREDANSLRKEKLEEGKKLVNQAKAKAEKNTSKAVEFVIKMSEIFIMNGSKKISGHAKKPEALDNLGK